MPKLQATTKLGRATFLAIEAITCPFSSQITTPIPTKFSSFNMTPSKLIMRHELGVDFHLSLWGTQMTESRGFRGDSLNETDRANKCHFPDEPIKYHRPPRRSMDDGR